jgi:hypothetical protein
MWVLVEWSGLFRACDIGKRNIYGSKEDKSNNKMGKTHKCD